MDSDSTKRFENVLYVALLKFADKQLKSGELTKTFEGKTSGERKKIREEIMVQLKASAKEAAISLSREGLLDPKNLVSNEARVMSIIKRALRGSP